MVAALAASHGVVLQYDHESDTFRLTDAERERADRLAADGTLLCLVEARELHARGFEAKAHALQTLVHFRGAELGCHAMAIAAANVCREFHGQPLIKPAREPS